MIQKPVKSILKKSSGLEPGDKCSNQAIPRVVSFSDSICRWSSERRVSLKDSGPRIVRRRKDEPVGLKRPRRICSCQDFEETINSYIQTTQALVQQVEDFEVQQDMATLNDSLRALKNLVTVLDERPSTLKALQDHVKMKVEEMNNSLDLPPELDPIGMRPSPRSVRAVDCHELEFPHLGEECKGLFF